MKKFAALLAAVLFLFAGCAGGSRAMPEDFAFSVGVTTEGRTVEYHSEGNLLVKKNTAGESEEMHTAELILSDSELKTAWDLFSMMKLKKYPDAPNLYDPGTPAVEPVSNIKLWMRADGEEKMIFAEGVSMKGKASSADGIAFMNTVKILLDLVTVTEEYRAMPDWEN
ncbi:MAG: hypothetical protein IJC71_03695 [Clostridia bacterium]|nr:hypothetical protein [Clostridia bacterium]